MPRTDLAWALGEFRGGDRLTRYSLARNYYRGDHDLTFAVEKFRTVFARKLSAIADNLCPAVVDSVADRLKVTGFSSSLAEQQQERSGVLRRKKTTLVDEPAARAWGVWRWNRMPIRATEVHREALMTGDGYVIVDRDPVSGNAAIWPQKAHEIAVRYSDETPGQIAMAAKCWRSDGRIRINLYYPDGTERYVTRTAKRSGVNENTRAREFEPASGNVVNAATGGPLNVTPAATGTTLRNTDQSDFDEARPEPNPYGRVPVFHFPNRALYDHGASELLDVIPLQDGLNKALCDMFVAMEFAAFSQRWVTGLTVEINEETNQPIPPRFITGADKFVAASDAEAKFGAFPTTDLTQFVEVQENLRAEIARVSGTPLHYLFITKGDYPSGEAMKSAEARFSEKLDDKQTGFGDGWEDVLKHALKIEGSAPDRDFTLEALWKPSTPESDEVRVRTALMKRKVGVSRVQSLKELGYSDETIEQMLDEEPNAEPGPSLVIPTDDGRMSV